MSHSSGCSNNNRGFFTRREPLLCPAEVTAVFRVDLDRLALFDKLRNRNYQPCLSLSRLVHVRNCRTFDRRFRLNDLQHNRRRKVQVKRHVIQELHPNDRFRNHVVNLVAKLVGAKLNLLVRLGVHQDVVGAIRIEILHLLGLHVYSRKRFLRGKPLVEHRARSVTAHLDLNEAVTLAGRAVLHLMNCANVAAETNHHPGAHLCSLNVQTEPLL